MAGNKETDLTAPKIAREDLNDFEVRKHARSNEPIFKSVRSKLNEIYRVFLIRIPESQGIFLG